MSRTHPEHNDNLNFWESVVDTVNEGLVAVDSEGFVRHINKYAARSLRLELDQVKGRHFSSVFCPTVPPNKCWVNLALRAGNKVKDHRFQMVRESGEVHELIANLTVLKNPEKTVGALISVRSGASPPEFPASVGRDAIFSSMAEGLFTVDKQWRITSFNSAAEQITGWREDEVLGKSCSQVFGAGCCDDNCPLATTVNQGVPSFDLETDYRDRHGERMPVLVNTAILKDSDSEAVGGVVSFRRYEPKSCCDDGTDIGLCGIIGKSNKMRAVFEMIDEVADSKATVLILGESGTGKELVARAIQCLSPRSKQPFVRVNCAAIPDTLIESELFGHVKGAFTDAHANRVGRFELADNGTIFLDEVGDLSSQAQLRLLRVLEEGEFQRLGSSETCTIDVRVIAATNRNLWQMVQDGTFRDDLYYRLNVIQISLPPLRERREDLPLLIDHFMKSFRESTGKSVNQISDRAYELLLMHDYPGNVRELENILEHAFARLRGNIITESKLPPHLIKHQANPSRSNGNGSPGAADDNDRMTIIEALNRNQWNREVAATELGISRTTLWRRMRELDLLSN